MMATQMSGVCSCGLWSEVVLVASLGPNEIGCYGVFGRVDSFPWPVRTCFFIMVFTGSGSVWDGSGFMGGVRPFRPLMSE